MNFSNIKNKLKSFFSVKKVIIISIAIAAIAAGTFEGIRYKKRLDEKRDREAIRADIELPDSFYSENYIPNIFIDFNSPVVNLNVVEKNFKDGIKISPSIDGEFIFLSPTYLKFAPKEQWKADTEYTISFNKKIENFKKLRRLEYSFRTPVNRPYISTFEFYENPMDIKERKAVATLVFPYPFDLKDVEKNVSLASTNGDKIKFTLRTNKNRTELYLDSEPIYIKEEENYINLSYRIKKDEIKDRIRIPSSKDYFKLNSVKTTTVFNSEKQEEEQILLLSFTRPVNVSDVLNSINVQSSVGGSCYSGNLKKLKEVARPLEFKNMTTNAKFSKIITLKINVGDYSNRCVLVSLNNQLISQDGFVLNDSDIRVNRAPAFTKEVQVIFDGAIVNANTDKNLTFMSRGYDGLKVEINRLSDDSINHLITQTSGDFKSAYFNNPYSFNEDNISEKFYEVLNVNNTNPAKSSYSSINLDKYFKSKKGIFIVKVNGYDPVKKRVFGDGDRRMIIVTDIGIMIKTDADSRKNIFISSLESGNPIAGARVEIIGKNGVPIMTRYTNGEGYILFPSLAEYKKEKEPVAYVVYSSGDLSFIPYSKADRELNYSRFDVGGIYSYKDENSNIKSYIFTDRDLYRPGETVDIGFILKDSNLENIISELPLKISINDVSGKEIYRKIVKNSSSLFDLSFETKPTMPTGIYTIYLHIQEKNNNKVFRYLTSKDFKLEEFQPDRMKIFINFDNATRDGWYNEKSLKGEVRLENLFGAPAQNRIIKTTVTVKPIKFSFSKYKNYRFTDLWKENLFKTQQIVEERPQEETDNSGIVKFDIDLSKYTAGTYSLLFAAEGFEPDGGRSVVSAKSLLISPLDYVIGYKTDSNLKYIKKDTQHTINLIAINQKLEQINVNNLKLKVQKISYESILTQESSGRLRYQKEKMYKDIRTDWFAISKDTTNYSLPTDIVGDMQITIVDDRENELAVVNYTVAGESNNTFSIDKNAELKLVLDRSEYNSGDNIEMSITAPYTGYGLITIERDRVYAYKWFKTKSTNSVQTIKIPENLDRNAYVNVSFMREINSKEIFMSPLSYAIAPFSINKSKFQVKIDLETPEKVKPGETLKINYNLNKNANLIIYGVDEGILQVAKYVLPNPLAEFTKKMALQVYTSQIFDLVLPSFEIIKEVTGIGGGEGFDEIANNLNPFARNVEKPVAFWSGVLKNKTEGTYEYKIPEYFNGKIRIMAVAVGNTSVGSTQTYTNSQADIVLQPNVPVNISPNDEIEVTIGVGNYIENINGNVDIEVTAATSKNLKLLSDKTVKLNMAKNSEKTASFSIAALDELGNAEVRFFAKCVSKECANLEGNRITSTISLRPSTPYQTILTSGKSDNKNIKDIKEFFNEYNRNELIVSPSPLVLTQGLFDFLNEFPYGCTEQIISKVFPAMVIKAKYPSLVQNKNFNKLINNTISELVQRQNNDGGFSAWPISKEYDESYNYSNTFHSIYAMHFLTLAKQNGYFIPKGTYSKGMEWLSNYKNLTFSNMNEAKNKAYALYVLTLNYDPENIAQALTNLENDINSRFKEEFENSAGIAYMASTYKIMQNDKKANELIKKFKFSNNKNFYNSYDSDDLRNVQYIYLTGLYFPDIFNRIKNEAANILLNIVEGRRYNTLLSSYSIMALGNFADSIEANGVVFAMKDRNNKDIAPKILNNPFTSINAPNNSISEIGFKNKEPLYYSFIQQGFQKNPNRNGFSKNIQVTKRILNKDDKEIGEAKQGDEFIVSLRIQNLTNKFMENVAIVDLLPSGFEIKEVISSGSLFLVNLREDRFLGYTNLGNNMVEISYAVKATTKGKLVVPPAYVEDLYNTENQAQSKIGEFIVK